MKSHNSVPFCEDKVCQFDYCEVVLCDKCLQIFIANAIKLYERWIAWDPIKKLSLDFERKLNTMFFDFLDNIEKLSPCDVTDFDRAFIIQADKIKTDLIFKINKK